MKIGFWNNYILKNKLALRHFHYTSNASAVLQLDSIGIFPALHVLMDRVNPKIRDLTQDTYEYWSTYLKVPFELGRVRF